MSKAKTLFIVDVMAFAAFLIETVSGLLLWLVIPHGKHYGGGGSATESSFIWTRQTWIDIHDWTAVAFVIFIIIHIYIHWRWIYRQAKLILQK